jgi:hypothetical protein
VSEHTPGPWHVGQYNGVYDERDRSVLSLEPKEEAEANARLIAAAPELLEACRAAIAIPGKPVAEILPMIEAAIAKADAK